MEKENLFIKEINDARLEQDETYNSNKGRSVSFLLGAGFSVDHGYPIASGIRRRLLEMNPDEYGIDKRGILQKKNKSLMNPDLDTKQIQRIQSFIDDLGDSYNYEETFEEFNRRIKGSGISLLKRIYIQMVTACLTCNYNGEEEQWYDVPNLGDIDTKYKSFTQFVCKLLELGYKINVHTLNHDMFFESFNLAKESGLYGKISDGFDEYGSDYFGGIVHNNHEYKVRLQRYTGRYCNPLRLFKLHGSLDYAMFHRKEGSKLVPNKLVKITKDIELDRLYKGRRSEMHCTTDESAYHAMFLTGLTEKKDPYDEPYTFGKLFHHFHKNLRNAEALFIIGYSFRDELINEKLNKNFDFKKKPCYVISQKLGESVKLCLKKKRVIIKEEKLSEVDFKNLLVVNRTNTL